MVSVLFDEKHHDETTLDQKFTLKNQVFTTSLNQEKITVQVEILDF